jgi:hypothetical protein
MWQGIDVRGVGSSTPHPSLSQITSGSYPASSNDRGVVWIKNSSHIEFAKNAITTSNYDQTWNSAYYGGIIFAQNSTFKNCIRSAEFYQFDYIPIGSSANAEDDNISEFYRCDFIVDNEFPCGVLFSYHISMWDVDGVIFKGCNFKNLRSICSGGINEGIYSIDATYRVSNIVCPSLPCPGYPIPSTFQGFIRGIHADNSINLPLPIEVDGVNFINTTYRGILLSAVKNSLIINNTFEIFDLITDNCYGLYLESCENYQVENNTFKTYGLYNGNPSYNAGIYVSNGSYAATELYRNTFDDLETGIRAQGNNRNLQIKCNTFIKPEINKYNIYVTSGQLGDQGACLSPSFSLVQRVQAPAGNIFSHDCLTTEGDFKVSTGLPLLRYKHHSDAAYTPLCYTTSLITLTDCNISPNQGGNIACPSKLPQSGGGGTFAGEGGESAGMMVDVANNIDESIINFEKSIVDGGTGLSESAIEDYEAEINYLEGEKENLLKDAVNLYMLESKTDSALLIVATEDAAWAKEREVEIYYTNGDYKNAHEKLEAMSADDQNSTDFRTLYDVHIGVAEDGRNILNLTEAEHETIKTLAGKQSPSGIAAENILEFLTGEDYPEVFDPETEELRIAAPALNTNINIYPNPVTNELFIQIENAADQAEYNMHLYDIRGSLIESMVLQATELNYIRLSNYSTGIYVVRIDENSVLRHIEKIIKN